MLRVIRTFMLSMWEQVNLKYLSLMPLGMWIIYVQLTYRVPQSILVGIIPVVGGLLGLASLVMLLTHLPIRDMALYPVLRRVEQLITLLLLLFAFLSSLQYVNGTMGDPTPVEQSSVLLSRSEAHIDLGFRVPFSWASLRSWDNPEASLLLPLKWTEEELWGGEVVLVAVHPGYYNIPWVSTIIRDEEHYLRAVVQAVPTASMHWHKLIDFYRERNRWKEANEAVHVCLKAYPNDATLAEIVGGELISRGMLNEGIPLLEQAVARRPTYARYQQLGWAMQHRGELDRAVQIYRTSISLAPNDWEAYFHLGETYSGMGKFAEASQMYEKVLERRPNFPEIKALLESVRKNVK